jgi:hypothetical protein
MTVFAQHTGAVRVRTQLSFACLAAGHALLADEGPLLVSLVDARPSSPQDQIRVLAVNSTVVRVSDPHRASSFRPLSRESRHCTSKKAADSVGARIVFANRGRGRIIRPCAAVGSWSKVRQN